jgi:hypothetical protein
MADRKMFVTRKGEHVYRTRMLKAGDSIVLDGPKAKLHELMGYVTARPARAPRVAPEPAPEPAAEAEPKADVVAEQPAKPRRRRAAKKKA